MLLGFGVTAGIALGLAAVGLVGIAATDASTHRIPNPLLVAVAAVLFGGAALTGAEALRATLTLGVAWFVTLLTVHLLDPRLGFGDVKLSAVLGMMIGLAAVASGRDIAAAGLLSSAAFLAAAIATAAVAARHPRQPVPFAPALAVAVVVATVAIGLVAA